MGRTTIFTRCVRGSHYDEVHVSRHGDGAPVTLADVDDLVARVEREHGAHTLRVVVFGDVALSGAETLAERSRYLFVGHQHPGPVPRWSVEVTAVAPRAGVPVTVSRPGPGTTLIVTEEAGAEVRRMVYVGATPPGVSTLDQALAGLEEVETALGACGLTPAHIERTWYFLADILDAYGELNKARDVMFDRWDLSGYPASTGIGATLPGAGRVALTVEATSVAGRPAAANVETSLQCQPYAYGPRFVRANRLRRNGCEVVNVSGISSIDADGRSLPADALQAGVDHAGDSFTDLLRNAGFGLDDLVSCYVYCKDPAAEAAFERWRARVGWSAPVLLNVVDVCRGELRFEIEGRAMRAVAS